MKNIELVKDGTKFHMSLLDLKNAAVAFFYDGEEMKLGTVAFAMPGLGEAKATTSSVLLGGKNLLLSRALAEKVAAYFRKMSLISVNTSLPEASVLKIFLELVEKAT